MTRREILDDLVIARTRDRLVSDANVRELLGIVNEELAASQTEGGDQIQGVGSRDFRCEKTARTLLRRVRAESPGRRGIAAPA